MNDFLIPSSNQMAKVKAGHLAWRSPSNIAIIKYWGKYGNQLPAKPSLSMTLEQSYTETHYSIAQRKPNEELVQYFSTLSKSWHLRPRSKGYCRPGRNIYLFWML
ncbi:MAG: hypothetical protein IPI18_02985 [Saprospiraceae bacterium]|nr:hypothetical protein [Saprospiraceae bacterium]